MHDDDYLYAFINRISRFLPRWRLEVPGNGNKNPGGNKHLRMYLVCLVENRGDTSAQWLLDDPSSDSSRTIENMATY